ncbi:MAG: succinylglutamate desuccinylase/aspartoacylase family protein, partial [Deltaproteobacteria bacterium]|nr:succinylglutamate desuccinylase/aspartoacylase family protein [Deltaproteobacteria bacterium]
MRDITEISGFHAHIYFDPATRDIAAGLREAIPSRFTAKLGRWHDQPIGPHTKGMYQVAFGTDQFAAFVSWLMLNRDGLSILVHPLTGDDVADHSTNPLWLGDALSIDLDILRQFVQPRREGPIGIAGTPWGAPERAEWRSRQLRKRSYTTNVVSGIDRLRERFDVVQYGELDYAPERFPLFAIKSRDWNDKLPIALITGGVHGYETSGVHGALQFVDRHGADYAGRINLIVAPCVSPWGYERIHRWNALAVDPNRSFRDDGAAEEAAALTRLVAPFRDRVIVHVDLHETTDSDETEFRPALAARDGKPHEPGEIPDGFYTVGDSENPQPEFQQAIIAAVAKVTHIAP